MTAHHVVQEGNIIKQCIYCGRDLSSERWDNEISGSHFYKTLKCRCGKVCRVKINYLSSGHDNFNKEKNLEMKIEHFRHDKKFFLV